MASNTLRPTAPVPAAYAIEAPLIPLRFLEKIAGNNLRSRVYFRRFVGSLPLLVPWVASRSIDELMSYLGL
ncbi:MAG: hypothetical protein PVH41_07870 [Anaerolineae bacterium]